MSQSLGVAFNGLFCVAVFFELPKNIEDFIRNVRGSVVVDGTGFEPAASAMPTLRSFQADLPAHDILNLTRKLLSVMGKKRIPHFHISTLYVLG